MPDVYNFRCIFRWRKEEEEEEGVGDGAVGHKKICETEISQMEKYIIAIVEI